METPVFVARERELQRLAEFLDKALAGQGQVCLVSGEAGSGKTALLTEFACRAEAKHPELVTAFGQGDAQTGIGDPYLPFRAVLGQLTGDVDSERARAISPENATRLRKLVGVSGRFLVEIAPDLVGLFVPGVGLAMKAAKATADKAGWLGKLEKLAQRPKPGEGLGSSGLEQDMVFEQYTRFLTALADKTPLLLLLDDLQWADPSSLALLFRLGRRIDHSRILILGTYRPEEVAQEGPGGRHPLEKVLAELKRYLGDIELGLDGTEDSERRVFVDSILDSEPNVLGEEFRQALLRHTDGHALFTVELLRAMQERGDLLRDAQGRWAAGSALDWTSFPARVEGVIEERIGRLAEELRAVLTVASVEGEEFTAEVVAQVRAIDARDLVRRLSEDLQKEHRLVSAQGLRRLEARRLALYRFQHNLFQKYLYNGMDAVERSYLHEDVGNVLEALYGEQTDEVAVQLARHFEEAGVADKAVRYLRRSGQLAAARYANEEAVAYFSRALALLPETDRLARYDLLLARENLRHVLGQSDAEGRDLTELEALALGLSVERQAEVAIRRHWHAHRAGDITAAMSAAQRAVEWGRAAGHTGHEAMGLFLLGNCLFWQGNPAAARPMIEEALALARAAGLRDVERRTLYGLGNLHLGQADFAGAQGFYEQAAYLAREAGDRLTEAITQLQLAVSYFCLGDYALAEACLDQCLFLAREVGHRFYEAAALCQHGGLCEVLGNYPQAQCFYREALRIYREIGCAGEDIARALTGLSYVTRYLGDLAGAREYAEQALGLVRTTNRADEGDALQALGNIYLDLDDPATARGYYEQALEIARHVGWQVLGFSVMRPLSGLAWVALAQGDLVEAQAHVAEILACLDAGGMLPADYDGYMPFWIYLTCYQVLKAGGDPRAAEILAMAHRLLLEHAARAPNEEMRRSFLENVAENREIMAEFEKSQQSE